MTTPSTIAVLLTCFNRKGLTEACLSALFICSNEKSYSLKVYLVDDGSTDGTAQLIQASYPEVKIIQGNGQLYWNGGMQLAWETALKDKPDFYLWLNDDINLKKNALDVLLSTFESTKTSANNPVIVGNLNDENTGKLTYGGYSIEKGLFHFRGVKLVISDRPTPCDTFNGNIVLIPHSAVDIIGTLDAKLTHAMGDFDYGLRCKKAGIPMFTTTEYIATCSNNSLSNTWSDPKLPFLQRWAKLKLPTGLPPLEYFHYVRRHTNLFTAGIMLGKLFFKLLFPGLWGALLKMVNR